MEKRIKLVGIPNQVWVIISYCESVSDTYSRSNTVFRFFNLDFFSGTVLACKYKNGGFEVIARSMKCIYCKAYIYSYPIWMDKIKKPTGIFWYWRSDSLYFSIDNFPKQKKNESKEIMLVTKSALNIIIIRKTKISRKLWRKGDTY